MQQNNEKSGRYLGKKQNQGAAFSNSPILPFVIIKDYFGSLIMKQAFATIAIILIFVAYIPNIRDTIKGKTTPHIFSWFVWSLGSYIVFFLQLSDGAGVGAFITLAVGILTTFLVIISFKKGNRNIRPSDLLFLAVSLIALAMWLFAKQPVLSVILLTISDAFAFAPTITKSWNKPQEETLSTYEINTLRHALSIFALEKYTIVTALFPSYLVIINLLVTILLIARRRIIGSK